MARFMAKCCIFLLGAGNSGVFVAWQERGTTGTKEERRWIQNQHSLNLNLGMIFAGVPMRGN